MNPSRSFQELSDEQYKLLVDAPALITILVAGADGKIDEQELNWAEKLTHIRSYAEPEDLNQYYEEVEKGFSATFDAYLVSLPNELSLREKAISSELSKINHVLACMDNPIAYRLYASFTSFAKHIAKASGGFLRFGSISREEKKWIGLDMIDPVILEEVEEELFEEEDSESDDQQ